MPPQLHYVEPYFGGGAVLLEKDPLDKSRYWGSKGWEQGVSEVVNDISLELTNFWRALQGEESSGPSSGSSKPCPFRKWKKSAR